MQNWNSLFSFILAHFTNLNPNIRIFEWAAYGCVSKFPPSLILQVQCVWRFVTNKKEKTEIYLVLRYEEINLGWLWGSPFPSPTTILLNRSATKPKTTTNMTTSTALLLLLVKFIYFLFILYQKFKNVKIWFSAFPCFGATTRRGGHTWCNNIIRACFWDSNKFLE